MDTKAYRNMIDFLGIFLGPDAELLLTDKEKVLHVVNPLSPQTTVGAPLGGMLKSFLESDSFRSVPYTINYRALSPAGEKLRSATLFLRDDKGEIEGMLTINSRVDELLAFRQLLDKMIQGYSVSSSSEKKKRKEGNDYFETLTISVSDTIEDTINQAIRRFGSQPARFTPKEKLSVVRELDSKGVFLVKGSVGEVAQKLGASEATIYRYLHNLQH